MRSVMRCLSLASILLATACCSGYPAAPLMPLVTVPENSSVRAAAGQSGITWLEPTGTGKSWQEVAGARSQVQSAIQSAASRLYAVDYPALSNPNFVTYTRALSFTQYDFTGQPLGVEAFGTDTAGKRWTLYTWQGPEMPQHPDRPLVHRWIQTYALYDIDGGGVTLLLATIRGEVYE